MSNAPKRSASGQVAEMARLYTDGTPDRAQIDAGTVVGRDGAIVMFQNPRGYFATDGTSWAGYFDDPDDACAALKMVRAFPPAPNRRTP